MHFIKIISLVTLGLALFILAACGGSGSSGGSGILLLPQTQYETVQTASYKFEYIPVTTATEGKTSFNIRLTNKDGSPAPGKTITIAPTMNMTSTSHRTPVDAIKDNGDGTYSCTIYFLMASTMADGTSTGTWELKFSVNGETATFTPKVAMAMGTTSKTVLKGLNDKIAGMTTGMTTNRSYYLFNDGISGNIAKLYIAALDDSMMTRYPAVSVGTTLHNQDNSAWTANPVSVEVSVDKVTWTAATDDGNGHWSKIGLMLSGGHLYVRLTVNGEQKTTDGTAVGASNGYTDFTVATSM